MDVSEWFGQLTSGDWVEASDVPVQADDTLWQLTPRRGWNQWARAASCVLGGQWTPKDTGCTWQLGRRTTWFGFPATCTSAQRAREIAVALGCECGYSVGSAARAIVTSVMAPDTFPGRGISRSWETQGGFLLSLPGRYSACWNMDVSGYYWSILSRLPSLRCVHLGAGRIVWGRMSSPERSRWLEVLEAVRGHKTLRNSLWGVCLGRCEGSRYWHRGELRESPGRPGPFRPAALAVVRAGWEITYLAATEVGAVYSHTDSVISASEDPPRHWTDRGFVVGKHAFGDTDIQSIGTYRCGEKRTKLYDERNIYTESIPLPDYPKFFLSDGWCDRPSELERSA